MTNKPNFRLESVKAEGAQEAIILGQHSANISSGKKAERTNSCPCDYQCGCQPDCRCENYCGCQRYCRCHNDCGCVDYGNCEQHWPASS